MNAWASAAKKVPRRESPEDVYFIQRSRSWRGFLAYRYRSLFAARYNTRTADKEHKFDVILDDRNERPGVKFKDMELIGVPYRITVGRGIKEGKLEWTDRYTGEKTEIAIEDVYSEIEKVFAM